MDSFEKNSTIQKNQAPQAELGAPPTRPLLAEHAGEKHSSLGAFIGIIIILIMLVVGALYIWGGIIIEKENTLPSASRSSL